VGLSVLFSLPPSYHRVVAVRRAGVADLAELASALFGCLEKLQGLDPTLDSFYAFDEAFVLRRVDRAEALLPLLSGAAIDWAGKRPPNEPTHSFRAVNRLEGGQYADLYVLFAHGEEALPGLSVELRLGHADDAPRSPELLQKALVELVRVTDPERAFVETSFQSPRAPERFLGARSCWCLFVPEWCGPPKGLEAPAAVEDAAGVGFLVTATGGAFDDTPDRAAERDRVASRVLPQLHAPRPRAKPSPEEAAAAAKAEPEPEREPAPVVPVAPVAPAVSTVPAVPAYPEPPRQAELPALAADVGTLPALSLGGARCGGLPWRLKGTLYVTVIAKASFVLTQGGALSPIAPDPLRARDRFHDGVAVNSLEDPTDLVPYLPSAEVLLTGRAIAQAGTRARLRLRVERPGPSGAMALIDKYAIACADGEGAPKAGFVEIPLRYENAFGGPGMAANPVGTGLDPRSRRPALIHPTDPRAVACFGPIAPYWEARAAGMKAEDRSSIRKEIPEIPPGFAWERLSAAPPDQRFAGFFQGNEAVILEGFHPSLPRVAVPLPGLVARSLVWTTGSPPEVVRMAADVLRIDTERWVFTLTFRGYVALPDERALSSVVVGGALVAPGAPVRWPTPYMIEAALSRFRAAGGASGGPPQASSGGNMQETVALGDDEPKVAPAMRFARSPEPRPLAQSKMALPWLQAGPVRRPEPGQKRTVAMAAMDLSVTADDPSPEDGEDG
jgi:hypothetical protein